MIGLVEVVFYVCVLCLLFSHQREFPPDCAYKDKDRKPGQLPVYTKQNIDVSGRQCQCLHSALPAKGSSDLLR